MGYIKENIADIIILMLLAFWGIYEIFLIPFIDDNIVSIFIGFSLSCLFPWCCKKTNVEYLKERNLALRYSLTFIISLFCALRIVEVLRERTFDVNGMKVVFIGFFLQSAYFLIAKQKSLMTRDQ